jgi:hypothetical protein
VTLTVTGNVAPSVALTAPTNGTALTAPASFTLAANAADNDGIVAQVEFFNGGSSLGVDTTSPYSITVNSLGAGTYTLSAVASDNGGAKATNSVSIMVNGPPTVALINPTNGAAFLAPASLTLTATATDADGAVSKVEFFQGATKLGEQTNSPYNFPWSNVATGSYSLMVRATDDRGASTISSVVSILVTNGPPAPVALLNPRWMGGDFVFSFSSQSNIAYAVQYVSFLPSTNWQVLTNLMGNGAEISVTNHAPLIPQMFYRVESK